VQGLCQRLAFSNEDSKNANSWVHPVVDPPRSGVSDHKFERSRRTVFVN
jgi:hypothetical protein